MFMNDFDIMRARRSCLSLDWPNRAKLVEVVDRLREWADDNSDGWSSWPKPSRAASKAVDVIQGDRSNAAFDRPDASDYEVAAALVPIKAFLTRQGVDAATRAAILGA